MTGQGDCVGQFSKAGLSPRWICRGPASYDEVRKPRLSAYFDST